MGLGERTGAPARAASTSTAETADAAAAAGVGAAGGVTAVAELDDSPLARTRARTGDVTKDDIRVAGLGGENRRARARATSTPTFESAGAGAAVGTASAVRGIRCRWTGKWRERDCAPMACMVIYIVTY